jgi:hypothetical protein
LQRVEKSESVFPVRQWELREIGVRAAADGFQDLRLEGNATLRRGDSDRRERILTGDPGGSPLAGTLAEGISRSPWGRLLSKGALRRQNKQLRVQPLEVVHGGAAVGAVGHVGNDGRALAFFQVAHRAAQQDEVVRVPRHARHFRSFFRQRLIVFATLEY